LTHSFAVIPQFTTAKFVIRKQKNKANKTEALYAIQP